MAETEKKEFNVIDFKTDGSLFIEASAGTGKTYTIQLMVAKMINEGTPLKKILIVTYTEKAAGELKDRIRKKIDEVLKTGKIDKDKNYPENGVDLSLFQKAYQDVDNAAIFTIHSFCQKALKEYAYDAGRPFDMTMIDDAAVEDVIEQLIRDKWCAEKDFKDLLVSAPETSSLVNKIKKLFVSAVNLYKGADNKGDEIVILAPITVEWAGDCISKKDAEKFLENCDFNDLMKFSKFKSNFECLEKYKDKPYEAIRYVRKKINEETKIVKEPVENLVVSGLIERLKKWTSKSDNYFTPGEVGEKIVNAPNEELKCALCYIYDRLSALSNTKGKSLKDLITKELKEKVPLREFIYSHLPSLFKEWQKYKAENKLQSFNDMILSVHQTVLSSDNSLKSRLRAQYKHAIIDEFQDTNQLQWDIFRSIFLKEGDDYVKDHSLFVVGDPKQSIYSFQGADVNVYTAATEEIGNRNDLFCNFRSTDNIINGCNVLFDEPYFNPKLVKFEHSKWPDGPLADKKKAPPLYQNKAIEKNMWLSNETTPEAFAKTAISKMIDWCSFDETGKTKLQVFDKDFDKKNPTKEHPTELKNVTFKDFAILAKSRSEMEIIEGEMRKVGIPYLRYKEGNLFKSKECSEWIAVFRAVNAPDFSSWNRKLLSEVLITDFFKDLVYKHVSHDGNTDGIGLDNLHYVESEEFDRPNNRERRLLAAWRALALKHRYAEMLEQIYKDTNIEERLTKVDRLQEISRLRQIGNYAVDYLYNHRCSLEDLVRHLQGLARYAESVDDENGDLVEKGSDFNAVQVMTIHASKGLEFPVVISVAGFKGYNKNAPAPYLYHDKQKKLYIGFGDVAKQNRKEEELEEWRRLFYVDFTRASSILVLPRYEKWSETTAKGEIKYPEFSFLKDAMGKITSIANELELDTEWDSIDKYIEVKKILKKTDSNTLTDEELQNEVEERKSSMSTLQSNLPNRAILQYSYSLLASRVAKPDAENKTIENEIETINGDRTDQDGSDQNFTPKTKLAMKDIDPDVVLGNNKDSSGPEQLLPGEEKYPRGAKIGNVLHNTLEKSDFKDFDNAEDNIEVWINNVPAKLKNVIKEEFNAESLPLAAHEDEWMNITLHYLFNTLHATLPVIEGGKFVKSANPKENHFRLVELPQNVHKPEVQFGMDADGKDSDSEALATLHRVCKGFIDLLFVRGEGDNMRYSILDWKSDFLDDYSPKSVKDKVDEEYSIQRVLYSYCLIKWLKQFYGDKPDGTPGLNEEEIFKNHFGGIYYAFLRGTDGKTNKGIYAQTWKDFNALKTAYENVKRVMTQGAN